MSEHASISSAVNTVAASIKTDALPASKQSQTLYSEIFQPIFIQRKLTVGAVDDPLEDEADAMANKVMRMPEQNFIQRKCAHCEDEEKAQRKPIESLIQKKCAHCEEEEKAQRKPIASFIQKKQSSFNNNTVASDNVSSQIQSTKGSGNSLTGSTKSFMESRFGADFSNVKIHTGHYASQLSKDLNAQAFTVGSDIYFNEGKYQPESNEGKHLLAHELTHTLQQESSVLLPIIIQRSLAIAPTVPDAVPHVLTANQIKSAIKWNSEAFSNADEISLLRVVLNISAEPVVIDEDFIKAVVQYQANFGLSQDGLMGSGTAKRLADELQAEATIAGASADTPTGTEMALNPAQRRMNLRSRVVSRLGQMLHQSFIGPADHPTGVVTVRSGFNDPNVATPGPRDINTIGINYTGANVANSRWLQFTFSQMSAIDPSTRTRAYNSGSVTSSGGTYNYSDARTFNWNVDSIPATGSMYYEAGAGNERNASHTEIFDQPAGWNTAADSYAATFATRPASVRLIKGFDTYLVVNNNSIVYHVRWNMYFNFNTAVTPTPDIQGTYEVLSAGQVRKLPAALKTVLDARFASNTVP